MEETLAISADDLLLGARATYDVAVPRSVLRPGEPDGSDSEGGPDGAVVRLRPLTLGVFQVIMRAARDDPGLIPLLMIKEALVDPRLSLDQVKQLHLGFVGFLIARVREISGLVEKKSSRPG